MLTLENLLPFLTLLIGGFIGNRLAIGRDRRKDFNDIANPLFETLEKQRLCAELGTYPASANGIEKESFIPILRKISKLKYKSLEKSIDEYILAKNSCGEYVEGYYIFNKPQVLIQSIKKLQSYLPHK